MVGARFRIPLLRKSGFQGLDLALESVVGQFFVLLQLARMEVWLTLWRCIFFQQIWLWDE